HNVDLTELRLKSWRFRDEGPLASRQPDDRESPFVVRRRGDVAERRVRIVGADGRAFDGLTGLVLHNSTDAGDLAGGNACPSDDDHRSQQTSKVTKRMTHLSTPSTAMPHASRAPT